MLSLAFRRCLQDQYYFKRKIIKILRDPWTSTTRAAAIASLTGDEFQLEETDPPSLPALMTRNPKVWECHPDLIFPPVTNSSGWIFKGTTAYFVWPSYWWLFLSIFLTTPTRLKTQGPRLLGEDARGRQLLNPDEKSCRPTAPWLNYKLFIDPWVCISQLKRNQPSLTTGKSPHPHEASRPVSIPQTHMIFWRPVLTQDPWVKQTRQCQVDSFHLKHQNKTSNACNLWLPCASLHTFVPWCYCLSSLQVQDPGFLMDVYYLLTIGLITPLPLTLLFAPLVTPSRVQYLPSLTWDISKTYHWVTCWVWTHFHLGCSHFLFTGANLPLSTAQYLLVIQRNQLPRQTWPLRDILYGKCHKRQDSQKSKTPHHITSSETGFQLS